MSLQFKKKQKQLEQDEEYVNPFRPKVKFDLSKNETKTYILTDDEKLDKFLHWNKIKKKNIIN